MLENMQVLRVCYDFGVRVEAGAGSDCTPGLTVEPKSMTSSTDA